MRWLVLVLVLVLVLCLAPLLAGAEEQSKPELGDVELTVPDRTSGERRQALSEGLDRVLVRLTGFRKPSELSSLAPVRADDPARWVTQYRYEDKKSEGKSGDPGGGLGLVLKARFDISGLFERLGELDAPVWDQNRPAVLLWLVVQEPTGGDIVGRDSDHPARALLEKAARRRGLPVVLPRMDDTDRDTIRAAEIRGQFDEPVRKASRRYDTPLVATAVLYTGKNPRLRWRLLDDGRKETSGNRQVEGMAAGLNAWVDAVTRHLVELYAVRGSEERSIRIRVRQLDRLQDWNRLHRHLLGLAGMRSVQLRHLEGATATFDTRFAGPPAKLERLAKLQPGLGSCGDKGTLVAATAQAGSASRRAEGATRGPDGDAGQQSRRPPRTEPFRLEFCWRGAGDDG